MWKQNETTKIQWIEQTATELSSVTCRSKKKSEPEGITNIVIQVIPEQATE